MSIKETREALSKLVKDDALIEHFLSILPVIESILEAFSKATGLPIFVYLSRAKIFQSSIQTMPPFCNVMLNSADTAARCVQDGLKRAEKLEPDIDNQNNIQYCHAGMLNGRCEIDTGVVGTLSILFGSKKSLAPQALIRRSAVIESVLHNNTGLAEQLKEADNLDRNTDPIEASDITLMNAIADIVKRLISATVGFRSLTINMAHELSLIMLNMGLLAREMETPIRDLEVEHDLTEPLEDILNKRNHIYNECQLALYVVRNFLSHTSETRYAEVVKPRFSIIDLTEILLDIIDLHKLFAETKSISFEIDDLSKVPKIYGSKMEISRLFHNVLNNAIKYSYHSVHGVRRTIRIKSKIPYDPGFRRHRFSLLFENYGLGISDDERFSVFKPGFRGHQAVAEIPIGAGIGLSEALKIMTLHNGEIKIRSHKLHESEAGDQTYLTGVELIFPYQGASASLKKKERHEH